METTEAETLQALLQQMQLLQGQMAAMANQHTVDQEAIRQEVTRLQAENSALREQVIRPIRSDFIATPTGLQPAPPTQSSDGNIKVEEFHGDRGAKYRTFKNHLLMKLQSVSPEFQLNFLASRCFGPANDFVRRFTDSTHRLYVSKSVDEVIKEFDQRFQGTEDSFSANGKLDALCKVNNSNYTSYYNKFVKLQDTSSYDESTLKHRFVAGLPSDIVNIMLDRLEINETLTDLQNYVSRYMDRKAGTTAWHGQGSQAATTPKTSNGPTAMDLDQVDLESLTRRPFRRLSDADRQILRRAGYWFCCRKPGFEASQLDSHRLQCTAGKNQGAGLNSVELDSSDPDD